MISRFCKMPGTEGARVRSTKACHLTRNVVANDSINVAGVASSRKAILSCAAFALEDALSLERKTTAVYGITMLARFLAINCLNSARKKSLSE